MPSRSDDAFGTALDAALSEVLAAVRALEVARPRIVIDGRSGSGKTTLAARLAAAWPLAGSPRVLAMDEFYPGWDGLAAASVVLVEGVLMPHAAGRPGSFPRWDWRADGPRGPEESGPVAAEDPLVVEGCGALTAASRAYADLGVWIDAPVASRRRRALARDGEAYAPHWDRWAAQETAHMAAHRPWELADLAFDLP